MAGAIHSMTGFGAAQLEEGGITIRAEVRTVNHRHLQVRLRLPSSHYRLEPRLEGLVKVALQRGAVQVHIHLETAGAPPNVRVNGDLAQVYAQALRALGSRLGLEPDLNLLQVAGLPGVLQVEETPSDLEQEAAWIEQCLVLALEDLAHMRHREGQSLVADLRLRASEVAQAREAIATRSPAVLLEHKQRLQERVAALLDGQEPPSEKDLAREITLLADRLDVSEELARLQAHLEQLEALLEQGGSVGRKLDFLAQEFMREANTIGSKCSDADTAHAVVGMKTAIERLREQIQNVE
ncbi:MAG: YicC family protein [Planctomycetes bacterium]|nr:YicC family protein [Planctomycetota bacterium]MCB9909625.1 YicC family protein [Planctomycetota bacterium]MCB9911886.1 YicC family protein [Planctomycetota bacterium]HPF14626.1 YicC family protein [Planctomycetota bacterium]